MSSENISPSLFTSDGAIDEAVLSAQFGLGLEEAMQVVTFGRFNGTVAEMLADQVCPIGGLISEAYQNNGIDGVTQQFTALHMMYSNFEVRISDNTIERARGGAEDLKKNPPIQTQ